MSVHGDEEATYRSSWLWLEGYPQIRRSRQAMFGMLLEAEQMVKESRRTEMLFLVLLQTARQDIECRQDIA